MAVEVVGGEVEEDRALGGEGDAVLELEAGGLADDRRGRVDLAGERGERRADVAGDGDRLAGRPVDVAEQLGDGRLAVGAGDGEEAVGDRPPGELELADHLDAPLQGGGDHRRLPGHARALDDGPRPIQLSQSIRIQDDFDARPLQPCRPLGIARIDPDRRPPPARPAAAPRPGPSGPARRPETGPAGSGGRISLGGGALIRSTFAPAPPNLSPRPHRPRGMACPGARIVGRKRLALDEVTPMSVAQGIVRRQGDFAPIA